LTAPIAKYVRAELKALAQPAKAEEMAAYMRTEMPFYGVQKPERLPVIREFKRQFAPHSLKSYCDNILALWEGQYREEKYLAINYAESFSQFIVPQALPTYEYMVRDGQWWDFVDPIASNLYGPVLLKNEDLVRPTIETYVGDEDFWIRRVALLAHLKHKEQTSHEHLFAYCTALAPEREFFIRKAIGWILREYSKSEPKRVLKYLRENEDKLSNLSLKEGAKHLTKLGLYK